MAGQAGSPVVTPGTPWRLEPLPGWLWGCAALWAALLAALLPVGEVLVPGGAPPVNGAYTMLALLAGVAIAWTVLWGALLGHRRAWRALVISAPAGAAVLVGCFMVALLTAPPAADSGDGSPDDNAPGAVLVAVGVPTLLAVALLLALGAGIGWAVASVRGRRG